MLEGADLRGAKMAGADLGGVNLKGLVLGEGGEPKGIDLRDVVGLTQKQVEQALGDQTTRLPDYLQPPEAWVENASEQTM